jgi:hypothetical protein
MNEVMGNDDATLINSHATLTIVHDTLNSVVHAPTILHDT